MNTQVRPPDRTRLGTVEDVAAYLGVGVQTIYNWRHRGEGPRASRVGGTVRFRWEDVDRWVEAHASGGMPAA
jgi:excisionase family DNA binding protein